MALLLLILLSPLVKPPSLAQVPGVTKCFYVMRRRLRKCINDPRKLAMDVAKFSACFCHQSIDHPVCKVASWHLRWKVFQCRKEQSSPTIESRASAIKASTSVLPIAKVTLTRSSSAPKNPSLLFWLVSLSYVLTESPWGTRRMKVWKSYGVICHRKRLVFGISETQILVFSL